MYVHNDSKLIFLANPRTGSTSVAKALMEIGFEKVGRHHEGFDMGPAWTTFAAVRNHWDTAVSWVCAYNYPFTLEFIEKALDNEYISENEMWGYHRPTLIVRYENLASELHRTLLLHLLQDVDLHLPKENTSANRDDRRYRHCYNDETRGYIYDRFKDEILRLGYEF